ncbi:EAL domain-containing protein [Scandinavium sp. TWS1a]|uniref:EAL domain-containing protein n=1 Tax=Scandinavium tedordense TaxID=2926521 RepID=UPI002165A465|nr:EAL domain-containing protein [Scandinavium tedordense]MCS2169603.1 EAL domain-containing protein [Scandinavium tedordense]
MFNINQIDFLYQPVYNRNLHLYGFEILSRLREAGGGAAFIQAIENSDVIVDLALKQLYTACNHLNAGMDCHFSLNVNEYILGSLRFISEAIKVHQKNRCRISFELSENINFLGRDDLSIALKKLHAAGFILGLDDFFSGESSINPIMTADISYVKADMSIIQSFKETDVSRHLLKTMVYFCNLSSKKCVAEGVENLETYYELQGMGFDFFQGYLFSEPVPYSRALMLYKEKKFNVGSK